MDPTRELVDAGQVGTAIAILSGAGLLLTLALAAMARARRSPALTRGALLAAAAALLYPLWLVYNGIEDYFGLDSVAALLINLGLFAVVGVAVGMAMKRLWPA